MYELLLPSIYKSVMNTSNDRISCHFSVFVNEPFFFSKILFLKGNRYDLSYFNCPINQVCLRSEYKDDWDTFEFDQLRYLADPPEKKWMVKYFPTESTLLHFISTLSMLSTLIYPFHQ